jgi:acetate kinase
LGLKLDPTANAARKSDADIASPESTARILVISTREDLTIVRETKALLEADTKTPAQRPAIHLREMTETV